MKKALSIIEDVVAGRYQAPELGGPLRSPIERIEIAPSLEGREEELVRGLRLGDRLAVVAGEHGVEVLGRRVAKALPGSDLVVLDHPKADEATADKLQDLVGHADALIAVGSGTVNDLCKYVAHRTGRQSATFATAPSMDGYVTTTVSITRDGFKLSLKAQAPKGVFFDLDILSHAPQPMILAGLGDTVCRSTAQVDWLLSHLLLDTDYAETPYALMREDEPELYAKASGLLEGDREAVLLLTRMLVLSGLGVLVTNTSHCGSMGEHSISHYIDMLAKPHPGTLHGQQVGIATWTMARLQSQMLAGKQPPKLQPLKVDEVSLQRRFGRLAPFCKEAIAKKPWDAAGTRKLNQRLERDWATISERLRSVMLPMMALEDLIEETDMPRLAIQLDIDPGVYREAVGHAHELRDRYSFLDLAAQAGILERFAAGET
jgi:glycerol-1-phosphate dehydrogenase [NAD(P)+]